MKKERNKEVEQLKSFDDESFIFKQFKRVPFYRIIYFGRTLHCFRVERLLKSIFYSKSWIDSSSKSDPPPDFHNDKHHIMMEIMRIDDSAKGKHGPNSFERTHSFLTKHIGTDYKNRMKGCDLYFVPNTQDDYEYNFKGYVKNFERVLTNHSNKVDSYHSNYPKCKTCVFFVCDESNAYYQEVENNKTLIHLCFFDKRFIEVIKKCKADYLVWFTVYKSALNKNNKEIRLPYACIYDVKHFKELGVEYDYDKLIKVK